MCHFPSRSFLPPSSPSPPSPSLPILPHLLLLSLQFSNWSKLHSWNTDEFAGYWMFSIEIKQNQIFFIRICLKASTSHKFFPTFQGFDILPIKFYELLICLKERFLPRDLETLSPLWNTTFFLASHPVIWEINLGVSVWVILAFHNVVLGGNLESIFSNYLTFIVEIWRDICIYFFPITSLFQHHGKQKYFSSHKNVSVIVLCIYLARL